MVKAAQAVLDALAMRIDDSQARLGLGQNAPAKKLLSKVLKRDPNEALGADLISQNH